MPDSNTCSPRDGVVSLLSMSSLRQIIASQGTALVLDAASSRVQVGWIDANGPAAWWSETEEAGVALFRGVKQLGRNPTDAGALIFCAGPGSILGIRTAATAIRTWLTLGNRPVYRFQSLELVARALNQADTTIIADARRQLWHAQIIGQPLQRVSAEALTGRLVMPDGFRHWSALPAGVETTSYDLNVLLPATADEPIFHSCDDPDAFLHSEPDYKTWTPQIHRAP